MAVDLKTWVKERLATGTPRPKIAEELLTKLQTDPCQLDQNIYDILTEFLETGSGQVIRANPLLDSMQRMGIREDEILRTASSMVETPNETVQRTGVHVGTDLLVPADHPSRWKFADRDTPWDMLDEEQFKRAIEIIIDRAPSYLFEDRSPNSCFTFDRRTKLRLRLDDATVDSLLIMAANRLRIADVRQLGRVKLAYLQQLPLDTQIGLVEQFEGEPSTLMAPLIVSIATQIRPLIPFLERIRPYLEKADPASLYRQVWGMLQEQRDERRSKILQELNWLLEERGYILGVVSEGNHRGRPQMQVECEDVTYVKDRHQTRYWAKKGDVVIINTCNGHWLTSRVKAVTFIPAHTNERYF